MTEPRIGALFAGYGGLDLAVQSVLGGSLAWVSEFDKGANKILAHRFPDVPNHGDITKIDWSIVEPVDILTGGSPCQDLSHAGKRSGMTEGTRSNLWVAMREAIAQLRPSTVIWENVRGAYSASADSALEHCPGCMGDPRDRGPVLRALGRVLGDLSDLGYVGGWHGLRAADVGAPHGRFRVFVVAHADDDGQQGVRRLHSFRRDADGRGREDVIRHSGERAALLPTPRTSDTNGAGAHGEGGVDLRTAVVTMLPTPKARDWKGSGPADMNRHDPNLSELPRLLPTPTCEPDTGNGHARNLGKEVKSQQWGQYADAIARWERLTRPAPAPTQPSKKGTPQLSPAFSEWMMGLPAGWVTDVPGITRNEALKALGNGVVPQQAAAALRFLLDVQAVAA